MAISVPESQSLSPIVPDENTYPLASVTRLSITITHPLRMNAELFGLGKGADNRQTSLGLVVRYKFH
jgi:hypothetical protein